MTGSPSGSEVSLLLTIRALLPELNEQEQKVGQYILLSPDQVVHLAISDLAQRCMVSDTTIFRFCKKVGTGGYQDLKIRLAQDLASSRAPTYTQVVPTDSLTDIVRKVIADDIKALEDTLSALSSHELERAADVLLAARRVDIYGSGGGAVAALELQYKLMRVGIRAVVHTDAEVQVTSAALLSSDDAAVGISYSGMSPDVRHALEVARRSGATTVAMTNHPTSPITRLADVSLSTAGQEALAYGYPLGARVAQIALIDVLYECLAFKRHEENQRNLERIAESLYLLRTRS